MKDNITSREDIFLAKIAGKDVDIKTMTPPVATSMTEKLMLDIADRIDSIEAGSGGDEYETVAEIAVGQMTEKGGFYMYQPDNVPFPTDLTVNDKLYWGEYPLENVSTDVYYYNVNMQTLQPTGTPAYILQVDQSEGVVDVIVADTDISNITVTILKKVSGGGSIPVDDELSDTSENPVQNKVIFNALTYLAENKADKADMPLVIKGTTSGTSVAIDTEIEDIYNAAEDGRVVLLDTNIGQQMIRFNLYGRGYDETNDEYSCGFSMLSPDPNTATVMRVTFEQSSKIGTLTAHSIAYV